MPLAIAQLGQPVLRQPARAVSAEEIHSPAFQEFLDDLLDTLDPAKGVGLAGPQVFQSLRVFLAQVLPNPDPEGKPEVGIFINPRLTNLSTERTLSWEGCLSFAELLVLVPRHQRLRVEYLNRHGDPQTLDLESFPARVIQHETDHLDGLLTLDRALSPRHIVKASEIKDVMKSAEFRELLGNDDEDEVEGE